MLLVPATSSMGFKKTHQAVQLVMHLKTGSNGSLALAESRQLGAIQDTFRSVHQRKFVFWERNRINCANVSSG